MLEELHGSTTVPSEHPSVTLGYDFGTACLGCIDAIRRCCLEHLTLGQRLGHRKFTC